MLCEICKSSPAKIHVTQFKDEEKIAIHLCPECAHEKGLAGPSINTHFSVADLLSGLIKSSGEEGAAAVEPVTQLTCPSCGLSFRAFKESGRFGCPACYETFESELMSLLGKIQKGTKHTGKAPSKGKENSPERRVATLRIRLKEAVRTEDFEEAAKVRDQIREMEAELGLKDGESTGEGSHQAGGGNDS